MGPGGCGGTQCPFQPPRLGDVESEGLRLSAEPRGLSRGTPALYSWQGAVGHSFEPL